MLRQVLKTTVSLDDPDMPGWSELANDIVVNEKVVRSRLLHSFFQYVCNSNVNQVWCLSRRALLAPTCLAACSAYPV